MKTSLYFRKGQSLIELAIFSSIIFLAMAVLISYGLNFNYSQRQAMLSYKRAMKLAGDVYKTSLYASITSVTDKAIPDPSSIFGLSNKQPLVFSSSAVRSGELFSEFDVSKSEMKSKGYDIKNNELPQVVYDINGKVYTLKTGAFVVKNTVAKSYAKRKVFIKKWNGTGQAWTYEYPSKSKKKKFDKQTSWDIDSDGEDELILKKSKGWVMDSQEGEIDLTIDNPNLKNGLLSGAKIIVYNRSALTTAQEGRKTATSTRLHQIEIIERRVRLNPQCADKDFSNLQTQIDTNNKNCYAKGVACLPEEEDYILEENGEKILLVKSRFLTYQDKYAWANEQ